MDANRNDNFLRNRMPRPMQILVNDFAIRSFRETADKDYITARMAYRARLVQPFRWSALHCLEKYVKGILLLNRVDGRRLGHSVLPGIERMKQHGKFEIDLSADTVKFIKNLEDDGAEDRYYLVSYDIEPFEIVRFDRAIWEVRRYCQPLDYSAVDVNGKTVSSLKDELARIHLAKDKREKGTCVAGGVLERIIEQKDNPAREALVWKNLFFGPSRRKAVKMRPDWEAGNSPFFLNPEVVDEVVKYVYIPTDIAEGARQFARQKAAEKLEEERATKQATKRAAKQLGNPG
jgi:hypothetical protein